MPSDFTADQLHFISFHFILIFIQKKFYVDNEDPTDIENLILWANEFPVDNNIFSSIIKSQVNKDDTKSHFKLAQNYGVIGFPTVIYRSNQCHQILSSGYLPFEVLKEKVNLLAEL